MYSHLFEGILNLILTLIPTLKPPFKGLSKNKDWTTCPPSQGLQLFKTGSHRDSCASSHLLTLAAHKEIDEGTVLCLASPTEECCSDRPPSVFPLSASDMTLSSQPHCETLRVRNKWISCAQAAVRRTVSFPPPPNEINKIHVLVVVVSVLSAKRISLEGKVNRQRLKQKVQH